MAFDERQARVMILALTTECERLQILVATYNAVIEAYFSKYPESYEKLKRKAEQATKNPNLREVVGQRFMKCYALATHDLDGPAAQKLLDEAHAIVEHMNEGKETPFGESD